MSIDCRAFRLAIDLPVMPQWLEDAALEHLVDCPHCEEYMQAEVDRRGLRAEFQAEMAKEGL